MYPSLTIHRINTHKKIFSIGLVWLFHLSAMIGITIGHTEWFVAKTPFNLLLSFALLAWNYPLDSPKKWGLTGIYFTVGMLAEWIGVQYGFLFGEYYYGHNLGPKLDGVPWLMGINWAVLILVTGAIANKVFKSTLWRIIGGATLMVLLDFFMEVSAPVFDFWVWESEGAPIRNYLAWFGIATLLHFIYQRSRMQGDTLFSAHLYAAQLVFFAYFYGINGF